MENSKLKRKKKSDTEKKGVYFFKTHKNMGLCHCKKKKGNSNQSTADSSCSHVPRSEQRIFMQQHLIYLLRHVAKVAACGWRTERGSCLKFRNFPPCAQASSR